MPIVVGLGLGFWVFAAAFGLLVLHRTSDVWVRSLVNSLAHPHGHFLKRIVFRAAGAIAGGVLAIVHRVTSDISIAANATMYPLARWFLGQAVLAEGVALEIARGAEATAAAIARLRHVRIPALIAAAVAVVATRVGHIATHVGRIDARERAHWERLRRGIDRLRKAWPLPFAAALGVLLHKVIPAIRGRIEAHGRRLTKLEKITAAAAVWAVVLARILKRWPFMRCGKVKRVGNLICGLNSDLLESLIADVLLIAGAISVVAFAREVRTFFGSIALPPIKGFLREVSPLDPRDYLGGLPPSSLDLRDYLS